MRDSILFRPYKWFLSRIRGGTKTVVLVTTTIAASCAVASAEQISDHGAKLAWTVSEDGNADAFGIDDGAVILRRFRSDGASQVAVAEALDVKTGKLLWRVDGASPIRGTTRFLRIGSSIENIAPRSGVALWRSADLCISPQLPTYVTPIRATVYVGCQGGEMYSLDLVTGKGIARSHASILDEYDQVIALGDHLIGVSGMASGARSYRQSAILKEGTLAVLISFSPDSTILGQADGTAIVADTCCDGRNFDSSPAIIKRISLTTGRTISATALHPFSRALPSSEDLPGAGPFELLGSQLYVSTSSAMFVYSLSALTVSRTLFNGLAARTSFISNRYAVIILKRADAREAAVVDLSGRSAQSKIWQDSSAAWSLVPWNSELGPTFELAAYEYGMRALVTVHVAHQNAYKINSGCDLVASNSSYVLMICRESHSFEMYKVF